MQGGDILDFLFSIDYRSLLTPSMSPLESILRISVVYLFLFFLMRTVLKREAASLAITDLLVVVLIADAMQNAMANDYRSLTDGLVLGGTLVFWDWFLSYAAMRRLIRPAPLLLIRDGQVMPHSLRQEHLTEEELASHLRLQGIERVEDVKYAFMEMDGRISVIPRDGKSSHQPEEKQGGL